MFLTCTRACCHNWLLRPLHQPQLSHNMLQLDLLQANKKEEHPRFRSCIIQYDPQGPTSTHGSNQHWKDRKCVISGGWLLLYLVTEETNNDATCKRQIEFWQWETKFSQGDKSMLPFLCFLAAPDTQQWHSVQLAALSALCGTVNCWLQQNQLQKLQCLCYQWCIYSRHNSLLQSQVHWRQINFRYPFWLNSTINYTLKIIVHQDQQ